MTQFVFLETATGFSEVYLMLLGVIVAACLLKIAIQHLRHTHR